MPTSAPSRFPARRLAGKGWPLLAALSVLSALFLISPAFAQQDLTLKVQTGTNNQYRVRAWLPLMVDVSNRGDRVEGQIQVVVTRTDPRQVVTYRKPVDLAKSSKQRHMVYVRPEGYLSDLKVSLISGRNRWEAPLDLNTLRVLQPNDLLLYALDSRQSGLSFLAGMPLEKPKGSGASSGQNIGEVRVAYAARPDEAPDDRRGWSAARTLVLGDFSLDALTPERLQAIRDWTLAGGTLIVAGGADPRRLQTPALAPLLPVTVSGVRSLSGTPLVAFKTRLAGSVPAVSTALKEDAGYVSGTGGLVAYRPYGMGRVLFVAFDPTLPGSVVDARALWKGLLTAVYPPRAAQQAVPYTPSGPYGSNPTWRSFADIAHEMPAVGSPSFNLLGGYLLLYLLCLSPVNYFLLRRFRRLEWAWVSVPLVILGFTLGAYGTGYAMKGSKLMVNQITHLRAGVGQDRAVSTTYLSLFSPSRHTYRIEAGDRDSILLPAESTSGDYDFNSGMSVNYTAVQGERPAIEDVGVNMWSVQSFRMEHMVDLGGPVEGRLTLGKMRISSGNGGAVPQSWTANGQVANRTRMDLKGCVLRYGGLISRPFDLPPGAVKTGPFKLVDRGRASFPPVKGLNRLSKEGYDQVVSEDATGLYFSAVATPVSFGIRLDGREPESERAVLLSVKLADPAPKGGKP